MRIDLHPGRDLAANVQHDLVAFLETGFDLQALSSALWQSVPDGKPIVAASRNSSFAPLGPRKMK